MFSDTEPAGDPLRDKPQGGQSHRSNVVFEALMLAPLDSEEFGTAFKHATAADLADVFGALATSVDVQEERQARLRARRDELEREHPGLGESAD